MKHRYSFNITMGNMSIYETNMMKEAFIHFLNSFKVADFSFEKVEDFDNPNIYYYDFSVTYEHLSFPKVLRFSEAVVAFSLFWSSSLHEHILT